MKSNLNLTSLDNLYSHIPLFIRTPLKKILMTRLESRLNSFYKNLINEDDLVFDIGANDGYYTQIFSNLGSRVISIEPQPELYENLKIKFKDYKNIKVLKYGIGDNKATQILYISTFNNPNSTLSQDFRTHSRYSNRVWDKKVKIKILTLNDLINMYGIPKFCKIDTEGYELEILKSLKTPIESISFEFLSEFNEKTFQIIKHLDSIGDYKYNFCLGMKYEYELDKLIKGEKLINILKDSQSKKLNGDIYAIKTS